MKIITNLALIVSTIGRCEQLEILFESILFQLQSFDRVIVVAQDNIASTYYVCKEWESRGLPVTFVTSPIGASLGRNVGAGLVTDDETMLFFPNDTCFFEDGMILRIREKLAGASIGAMGVVDRNGLRFEIPKSVDMLSKKNVWSVMEAGLFIKSGHFRKLGGFDVSIGTGASTPWQAGEATDLLLKNLEYDNTKNFLWLPTECYVNVVPESQGLSSSRRRRKIRAYSCGIGFIRTKWKYSILSNLVFLLGGLFIGFRRPHEYKILDGVWSFLGRLEGLSGRTFKRENFSAIT